MIADVLRRWKNQFPKAFAEVRQHNPHLSTVYKSTNPNSNPNPISILIKRKRGRMKGKFERVGVICVASEDGQILPDTNPKCRRLVHGPSKQHTFRTRKDLHLAVEYEANLLLHSKSNNNGSNEIILSLQKKLHAVFCVPSSMKIEKGLHILCVFQAISSGHRIQTRSQRTKTCQIY